MTALELIQGSKRALGRGAAMAVSAATDGKYARSVIGSGLKGVWNMPGVKNQVLTHAAYGAGGAVAVGMGSAAFNGRGYSSGDFVRQAALGAALGGAGTFGYHATRHGNMTGFTRMLGHMDAYAPRGKGHLLSQARRMGGF